MKNFRLRISLYAVVFGVAWSFIWSQLLVDFGLLLLILMGVSWYLHPINMNHFATATKIWTVITIIYLIYFAYESFAPYQTFMKSLQHLIIFILFFKLCNLKNAKDGYQIALVSFIALISAFSWNFEAFMVYPFLFTSFFIIVSLIQLSSYPGAAELSVVNFSLKPSRLFIQSAAVLFVILVCGAGIFLMVPRKNIGYLGGLEILKHEYLTGFSSEVKLGEIGNIVLNKKVAFRVKLNKKINETDLYWRGVALDYFNNKEWRNTARFIKMGHASEMVYLRNADKNYLIQKFYNTYIDNRYLFYLYPATGVMVSKYHLMIDENENLVNSSSMYQVYSSQKNPASAFSAEKEPMDRYLQLPELDTRIVNLSRTAAANAISPFEKAARIKSFLMRNYEYTMSPEDIGSEDPVTDFLLFRKKGHCEYFATALCVMLRVNEIPCRMVNGFVGGEYNSLGDYYLVRQSNAHSWVEAYFQDKGWYLLDATPESAREPFALTFSRWLSTINDTMTFWWENYVLLFSASDQASIYQSIASYLHSLKEMLFSLPAITLSGTWMKIIMTAISVIIIVFIIVRVKREYGKTKKTFSGHSSTRFYFLFIIKMRLLGYKKIESMTPLEFMDFIKNSRFGENAEDITVRYCKIKYGR